MAKAQKSLANRACNPFSRCDADIAFEKAAMEQLGRVARVVVAALAAATLFLFVLNYLAIGQPRNVSKAAQAESETPMAAVTDAQRIARFEDNFYLAARYFLAVAVLTAAVVLLGLYRMHIRNIAVLQRRISDWCRIELAVRQEFQGKDVQAALLEGVFSVSDSLTEIVAPPTQDDSAEPKPDPQDPSD